MGTRSIREQIINILGGRCSSLECKWLRSDGMPGCDDTRCLQIDHKNGKGRQAAILAGSSYRHYQEILNDSDIITKYQLLCANCNWIKRRVKNENGGGRKPLSKKLSVRGRDSYISVFRALVNSLSTLQNQKAIKKAETQISKLKSRLELDGVDTKELLSEGGTPRHCENCGTAIEKGFRLCNECGMERKRTRNANAKKQRLDAAIKEGRTPCHSCVVRDAKPNMATCDICSESKKTGAKRIASIKANLESKERDQIIKTLKSTRGKVKGKDGAASALSMSVSKLQYRLGKFGIAAAEYKSFYPAI